MFSYQVVVIGAGQAGLSAAYHLKRKGIKDFIVLDANDGPGGAWRHRWPSLTFGRAHHLYPLPGMALETPDPTEPSSQVVARYYANYETRFALPVRRPAKVTSVFWQNDHFEINASAGNFNCQFLINATGTWDSPYWPYYPGIHSFLGRQLHTHDFWDAAQFTNQHVAVVGAGASGVQFLLALNKAGASTTWVTRRPPEFRDRAFDVEWGQDVEDKVNARTRLGLPPKSVVATTGIELTEEYKQGIAAGILVSSGPMTRITPSGIVLANGEQIACDTILWATGFRASLKHLAPLKLRQPGGGIVTDKVRVAKNPNLFLVGYGASSSTLGANRAGRQAALAIYQAINSSEQSLA